MRTQTVSNFTDNNGDAHTAIVEYPELCVFVHSKHVYLKVKLKDGNNVAESGVRISVTLIDWTAAGHPTYRVPKYTDVNGTVIFDISRFLQVMTDFTKADAVFDYSTDSALAQCHQIGVLLFMEGKTDLFLNIGSNAAFYAFSGTDEISDMWWSAVRRLRWWPAYPFTFDFANVNEANIQIDGGAIETGPFPQILTSNAVSRLRVNPAGPKFNLSANNIIKVNISSDGMSMVVAGYSDSGHVTGTSLFLDNVSNTLLIGVDHRAATEADVYLRWLNYHGELCYWLFKRYSESRNVSTTESHRAMVMDDRYSNNVRDNARLLTRSLKHELTIYTDFLQQWEYEHLASLFDAPFVDMLEQKSYDPSNGVIRWNRVHVKAGNHVENMKNFSEHDTNKQIVLTLTMPDKSNIEP
ncbi:MAG: hypothetical protein IKO23_09655 [Bacteroidales bacterium]|nr:hypothetical protein [Bacteroidales bacterium]